MSRALHLSEPQPTALQRLDARIAEGEALIARQEAAIVRHEVNQMDAAPAVQLLEVLRRIVENYWRIRVRLIVLEARRTGPQNSN